MDRSGFPLSSAHSEREQDTCTSTPNDILHDSAARGKNTRTHDRVCPNTIIAVIGQMGERAVWLTDRIGPLEAINTKKKFALILHKNSKTVLSLLET